MEASASPLTTEQITEAVADVKQLKAEFGEIKETVADIAETSRVLKDAVIGVPVGDNGERSGGLLAGLNEQKSLTMRVIFWVAAGNALGIAVVTYLAQRGPA